MLRINYSSYLSPQNLSTSFLYNGTLIALNGVSENARMENAALSKLDRWKTRNLMFFKFQNQCFYIGFYIHVLHTCFYIQTYGLYVLTLSEKNPGHILIQRNNELRREIKQIFINTKVVTLSPNGTNSVTQEQNNYVRRH